MEKGIQTLLENYVSIYERPKKKWIKYTDEEKQNERESLSEVIITKMLEKRENENE